MKKSSSVFLFLLLGILLLFAPLARAYTVYPITMPYVMGGVTYNLYTSYPFYPTNGNAYVNLVCQTVTSVNFYGGVTVRGTGCKYRINIVVSFVNTYKY